MKRVIYVFLLIFVMFAFTKQPEAASSLSAKIDFNKSEKLNIFYEFNQQTSLANYLIENGFNILDHFIELAKQNDKVNIPTLNAISLEYDYGQAVGTYPGKQPYYVITLYYLNSIEFLNNNIFLNTNTGAVQLVFSEDMELLKSYNYNYGERIVLDFDIKQKDITQIFSRAYFVASNQVKLESELFDSISLTSMLVDKNHYKVSEWRWLEWFGRMLLVSGNLLTDDSWKQMGYDFERNLSLEYYKTNPVISYQTSYKSLGATLFEKQIVNGPSNFQSTSMSIYPYGIFLTPKSSCGEECNYSLYVYSSFGKTHFYSTSYLLGNSFQKNKDITYSINNAFQLTRIDLVTSHELDNLLKYTFLFTIPNKTEDFTLYYDAKSWDVVSMSESQNETFLTGPDGTKYAISKSDMYIMANDSINSNNQNKNEGNTSGSGSGFDFSAGTILNGFKNFIGAVSGISSAIGSFFEHMPSDLVQLLFAGFSMGMVALVIKIIL